METRRDIPEEAVEDRLMRLLQALESYFRAVHAEPQVPAQIRGQADAVARLLEENADELPRTLAQWRHLRDRIARTKDELAGVESLVGKLVSTLEQEEEWPPGA